jgi:hypothetical protein
MSARKFAAVFAAAALVTAGCSPKGGTPPPPTSTTASAQESSATSSTATSTAKSAAPVERSIGKTGWYDGFAITVDKVTATENPTDQKSPTATTATTVPVSGDVTKLDIDLTLKNTLGKAKDGSVDQAHTGYLEVNGTVVKLDFDNPEVVGNATATGTATATFKTPKNTTDLDAVLDKVTLVFGQADANQTRIPFSKSEKVVSLEPRGIPVGQIFGAAPSIEVKNAYLWPSYQKDEKDRFELWVEVNLTCNSDCPGRPVNHGYFKLTSPTGKVVTADDRSPWCCDLLGASNNIQGAWLVFVLDAPAQGDYTFTFDPKDSAMPTGESTKITL